jgi:sulfate transport system ATP-binding protein
MISARNVTKRFGEFVALDDVSVDVPSGALMALLGPSGSGKSTLLRVIAGLEKPDSGEVFIGEREATQLRPQQRGVGFVFQHYAPFKHMTVADNVAFGLTVRRRPKQEIRKRVHELLELVQLEGLGKRYPAQLSGGQRQRMALARALAVEPEVLLLDEPFGALDDVSVTVASGALTALLGPSGSGKSTLLRVIAGLETPDSGSVIISGKEATQLRPQQRGVGFVFQHYAPFKHMTVADNVAFGLTVRKRPKDEVRDRVQELLHLVQLEGLGQRYPAQLSGGQRQRMALARALAVEPEVLLLDEPFGALDARVRAELRDWLRRLHDEVHVTTVFVTHDQEEAMQIADEIVLVNKGRIEQVGTGRDLYERPANEFVLTFVGEATWFDNSLVRPHDVALSTFAESDTIEVLVERIAYLGFEVRVQLALGDGKRFDAQLSRDEAERLELAQGQIVYARLARVPGVAVAGELSNTLW